MKRVDSLGNCLELVRAEEGEQIAVESTVAILQDKLTEYGLVRTLSQQDVNRIRPTFLEKPDSAL